MFCAKNYGGTAGKWAAAAMLSSSLQKMSGTLFFTRFVCFFLQEAINQHLNWGSEDCSTGLVLIGLEVEEQIEAQANNIMERCQKK